MKTFPDNNLFQQRVCSRNLFRLLSSKIIRSVCHRTVQNIIAKRIEDYVPRPCPEAGPAGPGIQCMAVDSAQSFEDIEQNMPQGFRDSAGKLRERLMQGCVIFVAQRRGARNGRKEVVGYSIGQRGLFSALGRRHETSPDMLFSHYVEVLPEFRGAGVYQMLDAVRNDYCRLNGVKKICAVVAPSNRRSMGAVSKTSFETVGTVQRLSILRNLLVLHTPWHRIQKALSRV